MPYTSATSSPNLSARRSKKYLQIVYLKRLLAGVSANRIDSWLRAYHLPIIGRIEAGFFMMDVRTVQEKELADISTAFENLLEETLNFGESKQSL